MKLTFVDSGVLIAAVRGSDPVAKLAFDILDDPERDFASSIFVKLETIPKPTYLSRDEQREFYEQFFDSVSKWAIVDSELAETAFTVARKAGLSAMDSLHLAAAHQMRCEEFVTTEKPTKPLHRTTLLKIKAIRS
jgi:predicted nucleic acid-binding protein